MNEIPTRADMHAALRAGLRAQAEIEQAQIERFGSYDQRRKWRALDPAERVAREYKR